MEQLKWRKVDDKLIYCSRVIAIAGDLHEYPKMIFATHIDKKNKHLFTHFIEADDLYLLPKEQ